MTLNHIKAFEITIYNTKHSQNTQIHFPNINFSPNPHFPKVDIRFNQRFTHILMARLRQTKNSSIYIYAHIYIHNPPCEQVADAF